MGHENLPAHLRNRPDIRALELKVYQLDDRTFQVPGREHVYDLLLVDGKVFCTCKASTFNVDCSHKKAVENFLEEKHHHASSRH